MCSFFAVCLNFLSHLNLLSISFFFIYSKSFLVQNYLIWIKTQIKNISNHNSSRQAFQWLVLSEHDVYGGLPVAVHPYDKQKYKQEYISLPPSANNSTAKLHDYTKLPDYITKQVNFWWDGIPILLHANVPFLYLSFTWRDIEK